MIYKNEIPILEFDDVKEAVIEPSHEKLDLVLPKKCIFAFVGEYVDKFALKKSAEIVGYFESITRSYPVYVFKEKGEEVCLVMAPAGSAASTQILDWLIGYGVKEIISTGSCGTLVDIVENTMVIPVKALRDEGTSYHYLKPSRYVELNKDMIKTIKKVFDSNNIKVIEGLTWSTDGFYRETKEKVLYRKSEGCIVVEMECAALAACAEMRNVTFGQILFTADSLHNIDEHDLRGWGVKSYEIALNLCLEIVLNLNDCNIM